MLRRPDTKHLPNLPLQILAIKIRRSHFPGVVVLPSCKAGLWEPPLGAIASRMYTSQYIGDDDRGNLCTLFVS